MFGVVVKAYTAPRLREVVHDEAGCVLVSYRVVAGVGSVSERRRSRVGEVDVGDCGPGSSWLRRSSSYPYDSAKQIVQALFTTSTSRPLPEPQFTPKCSESITRVATTRTRSHQTRQM